MGGAGNAMATSPTSIRSSDNSRGPLLAMTLPLVRRSWVTYSASTTSITPRMSAR